MDALRLLQSSVAFAHQMFQTILSDCTPEMLNARLPGGTINPAGVIAAHAVMTEDQFIQGRLRQQPTILASGGFAGTIGSRVPTGPRELPEWTEGFTLHLPAFQEYMRAVFATTESYLDGLSSGDLGREIDFPVGGRQALGQFIGGLGTWHLTTHGGEIAALKGVHGMKGLPF